MKTSDAINKLSVEEKVQLAAVLTQAANARCQKMYEDTAQEKLDSAVDVTYYNFKRLLEKLLAAE